MPLKRMHRLEKNINERVRAEHEKLLGEFGPQQEIEHARAQLKFETIEKLTANNPVLHALLQKIHYTSPKTIDVFENSVREALFQVRKIRRLNPAKSMEALDRDVLQALGQLHGLIEGIDPYAARKESELKGTVYGILLIEMDALHNLIERKSLPKK